MPRIRFRDFNGGLWVAGGRDNPPPSALRRATGVSQLKEGAIRSARGLRLINNFAANQYITFNDALFQGVLADVLRDGVVVNAAFPQSGVLGLDADGDRLSFLRMPPQPDLVDWLFVAGGNNPFKIKSDGTDASQWGIDAPPDGFTAGSDLPLGNTKSIQDCDNAGDWTRVQSFGANAVDETSIVVSPSTKSIKFDFTEAATNSYTAPVTVNLTHFGTGLDGHPSADQDYIDFWIRLGGTLADGPAAQHFDWMEVAFALGTTNFDDNVLSRKIEGADGSLSQAGLADQQTGAGTYVLDNNLTDEDVTAGNGIFNEGADQRPLLNAIAQTTVMRQNDIWQRIRIPKATFDRVGGDGTLGWADVQAIRLTFRRSGKIEIYVDLITMTGGWGLQGKLQYHVTFKNSATGSRSNPNPTPVQLNGINRGRAVLGNLPTSTDPQVDTVEVWRTVGNGELFFKAFEVPNGQTVEFDEVVDFRGLFTAPYLTDAELPDVLEAELLELDNAPPPSTIREVFGSPHVGRAWWLDRDPAQRGNLFYSPIGRPESNAGFVSVTTQTDNVLQTIRRWNDVLYVLTTFGLYRIVGDDEPFVAQEVFGAPGTTAPDTVVETPWGLVYQAAEGPVLFDGVQAVMIGMDALGPLLRGYTAEGLDPFVAISAAYWREDVWLTDGEQVLVANMRTQTWRHFDLQFDTLYAPDDDESLLGSIGLATPGQTFSIDDLAADTAINYQLQTWSQLAAVDTAAIVQRVFIDIDTGGVLVIPTLIYADSEVVLAALTTASRQTVEYARLDLSNLVGVRLDADVTLTPIILYGVEFDCVVPVGSGSEGAQ